MGSSSIFFSSQWSVNPCRAIDRSSNESSCPRRCSSNPKRKSKSKSKKKQNYHQAKTNKRTSSVGTYSPTYMKKKKKKNEENIFCTYICQVLLRRPLVVSRALGCGARRGPAGTLRRTFGPRPGSVARALGVPSRASCLCFKDCVPPHRASQRHGNPNPSLFPLVPLFDAVAAVPDRPQ